MRRSAFWGAVIKIIIWAALIGVPLWFYYTYFSPIMQSILETYQNVQGTGADVSAQLGDLKELLDKANPSKLLGQ